MCLRSTGPITVVGCQFSLCIGKPDTLLVLRILDLYWGFHSQSTRDVVIVIFDMYWNADRSHDRWG